MSDVIYLYGFTPDRAPLLPEGLDGLEGRPVETLALGDFHAVFSRVPADTYAPSTVEARLQDLGWVAERGLAHERVVAWFVDHASIVPAPLLTLYSTAEALRSAVAAREIEIREQLRRFHGLREWDLKVAYDAVSVERHAGELSDAVRALDAEIVKAPPGRRYLLERKRASLAAAESAAAARREAAALLERLSPLARDVRVLPLPRAERDLPVTLHAALLAAVGEDEARLTAAASARAGALRPLGISVSFSGPWAPYRFLGGQDG